MMQAVIDLQNDAVEKLVSLVVDSNKKVITFKAPTGSGKTYMMADLMDRVLQSDPNLVFLVSSLSKGNLAEQNYDKFNEYASSGEFANISSYLISSESAGEEGIHIPTNYNVYVLPRDLYKDKSKLKQGALHNFLEAITAPPLFNGLDKKIILIKDECHQATNNLDALVDDYFEKVINVSATPKMNRGQRPDVIIKEEDAVNANLIKKVNYYEDEVSLEDALDQFEIIKQQYNEKLGINPCIIIQISNKDKGDEEMEKIRRTLDLAKFQDLKWMFIVEKEKDCSTNDIFGIKKLPMHKWRDYAKRDTGTIDVIVFKMVITEGWDIPRACMLYQVRDTQSKQLDEQVIGRVRRNPKLKNFESLSTEAQDLALQAYVWGIKPESAKAIREVSLYGEQNDEANEFRQEFKMKTTYLKDIQATSSFDVGEFINELPTTLAPKSIFELNRRYKKLNSDAKALADGYINDINSWFKFMNNSAEIATKSKEAICNYEESMDLVKDANGNTVEASFPLTSYYVDNGNYKDIGNWIWQRTDCKERFSFDSEAEKEWITLLLGYIAEDAPTGSGRLIKSVSIRTIEDGEEVSVKKYMLAKNYPGNSDIKYEYYLNGIHSSYPDFILKDFMDRTHIFETKSLNISSDINIDSTDYQNKIIAIKEAYKQASKLTGYYFYIPIKRDDQWVIYAIFDGREKTISKQQLLKIIKNIETI